MAITVRAIRDRELFIEQPLLVAVRCGSLFRRQIGVLRAATRRRHASATATVVNAVMGKTVTMVVTTHVKATVVARAPVAVLITVVVRSVVVAEVRIAQIKRSVVARDSIARTQDARVQVLFAAGATLKVAQYTLADTGRSLSIEILRRQHERDAALLDLGDQSIVAQPLAGQGCQFIKANRDG